MWKHVFKLDPDKQLSDEALEAVCTSGTDAVMVGGSSGVTFDNTVDLLARIRRFEVPCVLEISDREAIVPGFDLFMIPLVLNSRHMDWITGHHHEALKEYGAILEWDRILTEGYVVLNGASTAARVTEAVTDLTLKDIEAYARMADRLFRCPVFYMEYSGTFGDMETVGKVRKVLHEARLFYGGGIASPDQARSAAEAADTIVVGNAIYDDLPNALATVKAIKS
nr:heptaprenylglyceryl phosphate synthase [Paenibacillus hamazuiensis]